MILHTSLASLNAVLISCTTATSISVYICRDLSLCDNLYATDRIILKMSNFFKIDLSRPNTFCIVNFFLASNRFGQFGNFADRITLLPKNCFTVRKLHKKNNLMF